MTLKVRLHRLSSYLSPFIVVSSSSSSSSLGSSVPALGLGGGHNVVGDILTSGAENLHQAGRDLEVCLRAEK